MLRATTLTALLAFTLVATTPAGPAQDSKLPVPAADAQTVKSGPTKAAAAAAVPFRKDLKLAYPSLGTLGARIDAARRAGDPVTLAHAASELHVAEKVSGKTTTLTSRQLIAQAAELAALRKQSAEMAATLKVANQIEVEQEQIAAMNRSLKEIQSLTAREKTSVAAGQEPTAPRRVVVNNYTTQFIDVQVNGYLRGQVEPGTTKTITIDQLWNPIVLKGWGDSDETTFGPVVLQGKFGTYTWNINGDDALPNAP
jgi:hypothetical protein